MDENQVIHILCRHLERNGYSVERRLHTTERGIDVIARHLLSGRLLYVEAKGGTSSREGSARFGRPYTQSQVFDRVAKGVFTALELRAAHAEADVALAVPDSRFFHRYLELVRAQLGAAGITVFMVSDETTVVTLPST